LSVLEWWEAIISVYKCNQSVMQGQWCPPLSGRKNLYKKKGILQPECPFLIRLI